MNRVLPISVCIISGAEAHRIGRALTSVAGWTSEILVLLNEEISDGTDKIAEKHGAKVFREPWKGHIAQKNSVQAKASQPWILGLDADEVVSPELRAEIERTLADTAAAEAFAAYSFPRLNFFYGRWIRHGDWYPDRCLRLWRRGQAEWGGVDPHDKLLVRGAQGQLRGDLLHYSMENFEHQIAKTIQYANDFVGQSAAQGRRVSWLDLAFRPTWRFLRAYLFKLGFLDGWQGYSIAWMTAFYTFLRYAKVRAAQAEQAEPPRPS